jgi:hypothetical protein
MCTLFLTITIALWTLASGRGEQVRLESTHYHCIYVLLFTLVSLSLVNAMYAQAMQCSISAACAHTAAQVKQPTHTHTCSLTTVQTHSTANINVMNCAIVLHIAINAACVQAIDYSGTVTRANSGTSEAANTRTLTYHYLIHITVPS